MSLWALVPPQRPVLAEIPLAFFWGGVRLKLLEPAIFFNSIEFYGIKIGVVKLRPYNLKLNGSAVAPPVLQDVIASFSNTVAGDICKTDEIPEPQW